MDLFSVHSILQ